MATGAAAFRILLERCAAVGCGAVLCGAMWCSLVCTMQAGRCDRGGGSRGWPLMPPTHPRGSDGTHQRAVETRFRGRPNNGRGRLAAIAGDLSPDGGFAAPRKRLAATAAGSLPRLQAVQPRRTARPRGREGEHGGGDASFPIRAAPVDDSPRLVGRGTLGGWG
jgi:hypothetical protein